MHNPSEVGHIQLGEMNEFPLKRDSTTALMRFQMRLWCGLVRQCVPDCSRDSAVSVCVCVCARVCVWSLNAMKLRFEGEKAVACMRAMRVG